MGAPLTELDGQCRFNHKSIQDYFVAKMMLDSIKVAEIDSRQSLIKFADKSVLGKKQIITTETQIFQFFIDMIDNEQGNRAGYQIGSIKDRVVALTCWTFKFLKECEEDERAAVQEDLRFLGLNLSLVLLLNPDILEIIGEKGYGNQWIKAIFFDISIANSLITTIQNLYSIKTSYKERICKSLQNERIFEAYPNLLKLRIRMGAISFEDLSDTQKEDAELLTEIVIKHPKKYKLLSEEARNNRRIIISTLTSGGKNFEFIPQKFKSDKELALIALNSYP